MLMKREGEGNNKPAVLGRDLQLPGP